jgi:hypothetical protein
MTTGGATMKQEEQIDSDLRALAAATARGLPSVDDSARALAAARPQTRMSARRRAPRLLRPALAGALTLGAIALCPVPYTRVVGWQLTATAPGGAPIAVELPARDRAQAERRAQAFAARTHAANVTVSARTARVWGSVWAMAKENLLQLHVTFDGKSDAEVEDDIRAQLAAAGWTADDVSVRRGDGETAVELGASDGTGRTLRVLRHQAGPGAAGTPPAMEIELGALDDAREPGMTDAQLRDKIVRQLQARGVDGDVTVNGDRVQVRARHQLHGEP